MSPSDQPALPSRASLERSGGVVTALFALAWALTATTVVTGDVAAVSCRITALVMSMAAIGTALTSGPRRRSAREVKADLPADWRRRFNIIGAVQGGAIALAVTVAIAAGVGGLIPASVCVIVGLHFFPVARALRLRYRPTGASLCVIGAAGFPSYLIAGADRSVIIVGAGAALTLWSASFRHGLTGLATAGGTARIR